MTAREAAGMGRERVVVDVPSTPLPIGGLLMALDPLLRGAAEPSRRMLMRNSATFTHLSSLPGALDFLKTAGFEEVSAAWAGLGDALAVPSCALKELDAAAEALRRARASRPPPPSPSIVFPPIMEALVSSVVAQGFPEVTTQAYTDTHMKIWRVLSSRSTQVRVRKAVLAGTNDMEHIVNWILEHGEDTNIDDPIPTVRCSMYTVLRANFHLVTSTCARPK